MTIRVQCPGCAKPYAFEDGLAGKPVRCKDCEAVFQIPASHPSTAPPGASSSFDELFDDAVSPSSPQSGASGSPRSRKRGHDLAWLVRVLGRPGTRWIVGILVVVGMGVLYPPLSLLVFSVGGMAGLIGFVWLIVMAAGVDWFASLQMRLLLPWAWIGFIRRHWPDTRTPAWLLLIGLLTIPCDIFVAPAILAEMRPPIPEAGALAPHADEPEISSSPPVERPRPSSRFQPPARTRPRPAEDSRPSKEDQLRDAPVSGHVEFTLKSYEGDGDAAEVARHALQDVPWVVPETITVDQAGGVIGFDVRGEARYIDTNKARILLTRAGFRLGGIHLTREDEAGDGSKR